MKPMPAVVTDFDGSAGAIAADPPVLSLLAG